MCYYEEPKTPSEPSHLNFGKIKEFVQIRHEEPPFSEGDLVRTKCDIGAYPEGTLALFRCVSLDGEWHPFVEIEFPDGEIGGASYNFIEIVLKKEDVAPVNEALKQFLGKGKAARS